MKIAESIRHLADLSSQREQPDQWLKNASQLHQVWKVSVEDAVAAVDSHWREQDAVISECLGTKKDWREIRGLEFFATVFKDHPSGLFKTILANPSVAAELDKAGVEAHQRIADKTDKAKKISRKAMSKIPRTWRTLCIFFWTNTIEEWLPMPPICLLSDMALIELFADDDDLVSGDAIRQEINRGLGLCRPSGPRYGVKHKGDCVRFVEEHGGRFGVTGKL